MKVERPPLGRTRSVKADVPDPPARTLTPGVRKSRSGCREQDPDSKVRDRLATLSSRFRTRHRSRQNMKLLLTLIPLMEDGAVVRTSEHARDGGEQTNACLS